MTRILFVHFLLLSTVASAAKLWDVAELRRRFEVKGEMFVTSPDGKRVLYKAGRWNVWKTRDHKSGKIENQWSSNSTEYGPIAIRHSWQVLDDGKVQMHIEQYGEIRETTPRGKGPSFEKLLRKEERVLENLEAITWIASTDEKQRVVVRFTPGFSDGEAPRPLADVPISGSDVVVTDNEGFVWAQHVTHEGKYCGFGTSRGTLFLSFYPFPGGKEMGIASGNELEVRLADNRVLTFRSLTDYLPHGVHAKIYGVHFPERKSGKFPTASIMDRTEEADFVEAIRRWPNG